ncbi:MAG: NINE protein [Cyanobacteria bacterium P01_E01_bin.34]
MSSSNSSKPIPVTQPVRYRNKPTAYALWFLALFGLNGAHRFYLGKNVTGGLWFFTAGWLYVGQFIDLFLIPGMVDDYNLRQEALLARGNSQPAPSFRSNLNDAPTQEPLKGQALMRRLIKLAARRTGLLSVTAAIAEIDEADFDDIEQAFQELERRGYAYCENDLVTGAIQYRFLQLETDTAVKDR